MSKKSIVFYYDNVRLGTPLVTWQKSMLDKKFRCIRRIAYQTVICFGPSKTTLIVLI